VELTQTASVRLPVDLDAASIAALTLALREALASPAPVVTITGANADTFCLGLAIGAGTERAAPTHAFSDLLTMMHHAPKPLLAVVDGRAIGGGMGLACACDWVVASDRATFALPELLWGLVPAIIWPVLTDRMAPHAVRQWTVSAYSRSAAEAHAAGLVDELLPAAQLERGVRRGERTLCRLDPEALLRLRGWMRESRQFDLPGALHRGAEITAGMLRRPAVQRRWQAFAAGESPWSG
jgi:enoyl-CoA hydratase/carnithine racemase